MCLGIAGQVIEIVDAEKQLGRVDVLGATRTISLVLLAPDEVQVGTWVLINASMAIRLPPWSGTDQSNPHAQFHFCVPHSRIQAQD